MKKAEKSWVMADMLQGEKVVNVVFFLDVAALHYLLWMHLAFLGIESHHRGFICNLSYGCTL